MNIICFKSRKITSDKKQS